MDDIVEEFCMNEQPGGDFAAYDVVVKEETEVIDYRSMGTNLESVERAKKKEMQDLMFAQALASVGQILFTKTQKLSVKKLKRVAAKKMCKILSASSSSKATYTPDQVMKRVNNLKQRLKRKADLKRRGEIELKESERIFIELLHAHQDNKGLPLQNCFDSDDSCIDDLSDSSQPAVASPHINGVSSETEAIDTDNKELQRSVLENQMELINAHKRLIASQEQRQQEEHERKMELYELQSKVLLKKLLSYDSN